MLLPTLDDNGKAFMAILMSKASTHERAMAGCRAAQSREKKAFAVLASLMQALRNLSADWHDKLNWSAGELDAILETVKL